MIGDVRNIRLDNHVGSTNNQKNHQLPFGSVRHKLTFKAERCGMQVALQDEHYTSRTCPACMHVLKGKATHGKGVSLRQQAVPLYLVS